MMFGGSHTTWREEFEVRRSHHGTIKGVEFDFRHSALQPELWALPHLVSERPRGHPGFFIASGLDDNTQTLGGTVAELAASSAAEARQDGRDILYPGDRVVVSRIEFATEPNPLGHASDKDKAVLHLQVLRSGGATEDLTPMVLLRRGRIGENFNELDTIETLADRQGVLIGEVAEHQDLDELRFLVIAQKDRLAAQIREAIQEEEGLGGWSSFAVQRLANIAALYGYRHGRLEAASAMEPLARRTLERQQQAREAGKKNRNTARTDYATNYWKKYPEATGYEVARAYLNDTREDADQSSVERSIKAVMPSTSRSYKRATE